MFQRASRLVCADCKSGFVFVAAVLFESAQSNRRRAALLSLLFMHRGTESRACICSLNDGTMQIRDRYSHYISSFRCVSHASAFLDSYRSRRNASCSRDANSASYKNVQLALKLTDRFPYCTVKTGKRLQWSAIDLNSFALEIEGVYVSSCQEAYVFSECRHA